MASEGIPGQSPQQDWGAVLDRLAKGDATAFLRFTRLVTGCLIQLRAYDFESEWDDLRQEVTAAVLEAREKGRLQEPEALVAYVRAVTRNKVFDRIKRRIRRSENETLPWEEASLPAAAVSGEPEDPVGRQDLRDALATLPDEERTLVVGVYVEGHSYPEMARRSGVPLGTLKRRLRDGLARLRARLDAAASSRPDRAGSDPEPARRETHSP
ncbi:MAG: sigma-70 family RNA polymerase sigma factor [Myxococcota bacterium]|nr:sigma-70 family RNA polymerase sigma factor [Myxococcota bacterium]